MYSQYIMLVPEDKGPILVAAKGQELDGPMNGYYYACSYFDPDDYQELDFIEWHLCSGNTKQHFDRLMEEKSLAS